MRSLLAIGELGRSVSSEAFRAELSMGGGVWCGCLAGPEKCSRPCAGCCGGNEAVCFSGMDPTGGGRGCHAARR